MKQSKKQITLITLVLICLVLLIYSPHIINPFPIHIDEYHHITESIKLKQGEFPKGLQGARIGFHVILAFLSLFTNLILTYKFLPAIWAIITSLTLFYITKSKTAHLSKSFFISLFTIIFFASLKSNANITGLWFFIPLTFSIPFIYLYIYFFSEGIRLNKKNYLVASLTIMLFLIPIHSISVLFAIPCLIIYLLINLEQTKKQYKILLTFLLVPILGLILYSFLLDISLIQAFLLLLKELQFKQGWGVLEIKNSFFELYSPIGYLLAILGCIYISTSKKKFYKYGIYILWPITLLISILIFKFTGVSFLSPYQRNLYYLAISLPFLSALGLFYLIKVIKKQTNKLSRVGWVEENSDKTKKIIYHTLVIILITLVIILTFQSYYTIPENIRLYEVLDKEGYETLEFLSTLPSQLDSKVIAPIDISPAVFPVSKKHPVATMFFYGDRIEVEKFFESSACETKNNIIKKHNVNYILSKNQTNCNWELIYNKNNNFIYRI